jgi:hypothetical protein
MAGSVVQTDRLRRTTRGRTRLEGLVAVPLETKGVDDVQPEGRRTLDRVARDFRLEPLLRRVARAELETI